MISGLVAVVTVGQFASARPDAGTAGNGMALPAITIAVLGGVAITGGIGRVPAWCWRRCCIVWLNAGHPAGLRAATTDRSTSCSRSASVLVFAALLNGFASRRYGGLADRRPGAPLVSPELVALTLLGEPDRDLVILAEGNTSELLDDGRLVVKASGAGLAVGDGRGLRGRRRRRGDGRRRRPRHHPGRSHRRPRRLGHDRPAARARGAAPSRRWCTSRSTGP